MAQIIQDILSLCHQLYLGGISVQSNEPILSMGLTALKYMYACVATTTIKIQNTSVMPHSSLVPHLSLCVFSPHSFYLPLLGHQCPVTFQQPCDTSW